MNILFGGYKGKLYPVNPKENTVQGLKAYPTVLDIPDEVDLAIFVIPSEAIPDAISRCVKKGIKAGIVITGDKVLLEMQDYMAIKIVSPKDFLSDYRKNGH